MQYGIWDVPAEELPSIVWRARQADVMGFNVTKPHKEAVMALLDEVEPAAKAIGAVNTIVRQDGGRLVAHNTDLYGFMRSLREAGCEPAGLSVVMLGTGGAARAVGTGLSEAGVRDITLVGRSPGNLGSTTARIGRAGDGKVGLRALPGMTPARCARRVSKRTSSSTARRSARPARTRRLSRRYGPTPCTRASGCTTWSTTRR